MVPLYFELGRVRTDEAVETRDFIANQYTSKRSFIALQAPVFLSLCVNFIINDCSAAKGAKFNTLMGTCGY